MAKILNRVGCRRGLGRGALKHATRRQLLFESFEDRRLLAAVVGPLPEGEGEELIVDNADSGVTVEGIWTSSTSTPGFNGTDYLFSRPESVFNPISASSSVTFTPDLVTDGNYAVFARWTSHTNRATNARVTINHREGVFETVVNQRTNGGTWVALGQFNLIDGAGHGVTVGADGVNGVVIADAIRFVRLGELDPPALPVNEVIVDNADLSGVRTDGNWLTSAGIAGFFDSNYLYTSQPTSSEVTFTPNLGSDGRFEVFVRWTGHANRASNAPISVDHSNGVFETRLNQRVGGGQWNSLGEFNLETGVSKVVIGGDSADGIVVADAVRFVRTGDAAFAPEITVSRGGLEVPDGGTANFGSTTVGNSVEATLSIRNNGNAQLVLSPLSPADVPSGFAIVAAPATVIAPGQVTSLILRMSATNVGSVSGTISLINNDGNENPYRILLAGVVNSTSAEEVIVDNDDGAGVQIVGDWRSSTFSPGFLEADYLFSPTAGNHTVIYTPNLGSDGRYQVFARWTSDPNRATNAPITVNHNGGASLTLVNQQTMGGEWVPLGEFNLESGVSNVMVGTAGVNGVVVADAVRFVRLGGIVPEPEITVLRNGANILDGGTVDFGQATVGNPTDIDLTVRNDGNAPLVLSSFSTPPNGFQILSLPPTTLQTGQAGILRLRMIATAEGTFSGVQVITTNDSTESLFELTLQGTVTGVTSTAPEITVLDSAGNHLIDGGTFDFQETVVGSPVDKLLTIRNDGGTPLVLTPLDSSTLPAGFSGAAPPTSTLAPGQSVVWALRLDASQLGTFSGQLSIINTDSNENPYDVNLTGTVSSVVSFAPEITVLDSGGSHIADGGTLEFGQTLAGSPVDKLITIRNDGNDTLTLSPLDPNLLPAGFSGVAPPTSSLFPGQSIAWVLRLDAVQPGTFTGQLAIANNDLNENPYEINLQGTVNSTTLAPEITVLDSTGAVLSDGGVVDFGVANLGSPVDRTIVIRNDGTTSLAIVPLSQGSLPSGFTGFAPNDSSLQPGESVAWTLRMLAATEGSFSGPFTIASNDADESSYDLTLQGTVGQTTGPEISVFADGVEQLDGGILDFGTATLGSPVDVTITIRNDGNANLSLTLLDSADLPAGYTGVSSGITNLSPGQATVWVLRLNADAAGVFSGPLAIVNGDANENPFRLTLTGNVDSVLADEVILDNDDGVGVLIQGDWSTSTSIPGFFDADYLSSAASSSSKVTFTPNLSSDGRYEVFARWTSHPNRASNTSITIVHNDGTFATQVNQREMGGQWVSLGVFDLEDGVSNVMISATDANGFVIADAVRFVRVGDSVPGPEISVSSRGVDIADGGVLNFGQSNIGSPVDVDVTIRNDGDRPLVISINGSPPTGFGFVALPSTPLQPGQIGTLRLRMSATTAGTFSGLLAITTNDANENPFDLILQGTVSNVAAPEISLFDSGGNVLADGGVLDFGQTTLGSSVEQTIIIRNDGNASLTIGQLNQNDLPNGFSGVASNTTTLGPGQAVVWTLRLTAATEGVFSGPLAIINNDTNENPYDLTLQGTVGGIGSPEISVFADGVARLDGGTIDFGTTLIGSPVDVLLTIRNTGNANLSLGSLQSANLPNGFTGVAPAVSTLGPGQSTVWVLRLTAATPGTFTGQLDIFNGDSDENPFDLTLQGTVVAAAPEISLFANGNELSDGGSLGFGSTPLGTPVDIAVTVRNDGDSNLTLGSLAGSVPTGFTLLSPPATTISPDGSTSFTLRMLANSAGTISGQIELANNDPNEDPFNLTLNGTVTSPEMTVLLGGVQIADGGTIDFGVTPLGSPVDRVLDIRNDGSQTLTLAAIQPSSLPAGFQLVSPPTSLSLAPGQSTSLTLRLAATAVNTNSGTLSIGNNDVDENPYDLVLQGSVRIPGPEISLLVGNAAIADGGTIDFGITSVGRNVDVVVTILNEGEDPLTLQTINPGSAPAGFAIIQTPNASTLLPGQQTSLRLRLLANSPGPVSGAIAIFNNDADENPFNIQLVGEVADKRYIGTATGSAIIPSIGTFPVNEPLDFLIAGDNVAVLLPNGGGGTVVGNAITFGISDSGLGGCTFTGSFSSGEMSVSGNWTCPALAAGGSASGTWEAMLVGEGEAEGEGGSFLASLPTAGTASVEKSDEPRTAWEEAVDGYFGQN